MNINGIDEKDNEIINLLLKDGRMTFSDIGEKVGLSRTAVKNRISALERTGIISGYSVVVNPQESPEMMTFVVNIEIQADCFEEAKQAFAEAPETLTLLQTTGRCHLVAVCVSEDIKTMRDFVNKVYKEVKGINSVTAQPVLDVIKGSIVPK